jgi:hypothetical protein
MKNCENAVVYHGTPPGHKLSIPAEGVFSCDQHTDALIDTYYDINKHLKIKKYGKI